jgi:hypothetical protein
MLPIDNESIKRVTNGDMIVRGIPADILKSKYEDGWCVVRNIRESEELEVERSGLLGDISSMTNVKRRLSYGELTDNDWYILDAELR